MLGSCARHIGQLASTQNACLHTSSCCAFRLAGTRLPSSNRRRNQHKTRISGCARGSTTRHPKSPRFLATPESAPIGFPIPAPSRDLVVSPHRVHNDHSSAEASIPYPRDIVRYLDQHVIGQDHAKRALAVGVYQHYKRVVNNLGVMEHREIRECLEKHRAQSITEKNGRPYVEENLDFRSPKERFLDSVRESLNKLSIKRTRDDMLMEKSNIILTGPSGSGKTHLTQQLASILNVPIALCDCTTLTQAGYVGDDVDTVIQRLLQNADGDVERAETGIVFLDEVDKINTSVDPEHSTGNRDVSGRGVQQALLKLVEGHVIKVKNPVNPLQKVDVDTSNILFIGSGAFNSLDRIVAKRLEQRSMGFGASRLGLLEGLDGDALRKDEMLTRADQGDLIEFGLIPELVGRFPVLVPFHSLDRNLLIRVLTEPSNSLIAQAQQLFALDGINLKFTPCAVEAMAEEAAQRRTGARALRSIIERVLLQAKFDLPGTNTRAVVFDRNTIEGRASYRVVMKTEKSDSN